MRHTGIALLALVSTTALAANPPPSVSLQVLGTYQTGVFEKGAAEIIAYDPLTRRVFVVNAAATSVDVLDVADPTQPTKIATIDAGSLGDSANSVAVKNGLVAVAIQADVKTDPGLVAVYDSSTLALLKTFPAGALPDMLAFSPAGDSILVANEGEPNDVYTIDPEGSLTLVDLSHGLDAAQAWQIDFHKFDSKRAKLLEKGVRLFGPNATVSQDFEPEYVTFSWDGKIAWVTLQENNALAKVDLVQGEVLQILPLGTKDHNLAENAFDPSDRDGGINIGNWPVSGLYLPDSIASFCVNGETYLVTANEGDTRAWAGFNEEARVKDLKLDPVAFPAGADLRKDPALGRLTVTKTLGDTDGDGDHDTLYTFGARSFSIWNPAGKLVFDSGRAFEDLLASIAAPDFNSDHAASGTFDTRSDNKGPEPEGIAVGEINGRVYAFIGLERQSGIVVYDVTKPRQPVFQDYLNNRNFLVPTRLADGSSNPAAGDLGPEGLAFIDAAKSPNGKPLLVVGNEISGTTTLYEVVTTPAN
jgi:hypothetical protein